MFDFANEIPITLEALNRHGEVLSGLDARLRHLDESRAIVSLDPNVPLSHLHWGSNVRFHVREGAHRFSIAGTVVSHDLSASRSRRPEPGSSEAASCEAILSLSDFRFADPAEHGATQDPRFVVSFRPLLAREADESGADSWMNGICVGIGGGGMRLCVADSDAHVERVALRFALPAKPGSEEPGRLYTLGGRVLNSGPCARMPGRTELAIRFARISVEQAIQIASSASV